MLQKKSLLIATHNQGKAREFSDLLSQEWEVSSLADFPHLPEVVEDGASFEENAKKKALENSLAMKEWIVLADDSGLEVDFLNGAPGIFSARYSGENATPKSNNEKLLAKMGNSSSEATQRGAQFRCVVALAQKGEIISLREGICRGIIAEKEIGSEGFGYDPLFIPEGCEQTFAEMPLSQKQSMSHRGKAIEKILEILKTL